MIAGQGLSVSRGGRRILDVDEVCVGAGEMLGILGPNGAGKSTLLRVLAGELVPDAGRVTFLGRLAAAWSPGELARHRAVMPQSTTLGFPLRVREVVALGRTPHAGRCRREADESAVAEAMGQAGVGAMDARWFATLSGGEQQRVHLARVLAQLAGTAPRAAALFLDEPTASLDLPHQHGILRAAGARAAQGIAVVVVLHDLSLAARCCTRLLLMAEGRVIADGIPAQALTEANITRAYGARVRRIDDPVGGEILFVMA